MTEIAPNGDQTPASPVALRRDTELVQELQLARLRAMTATEKVAVMHALHRQAWALTRAGMRARHPECTEFEVEARVRAHFLQPQP
jgi:Xaa-Pro aminopeptidase